MHVDLPCTILSPFLQHSICCANVVQMFPHTYFSIGFSKQIFPQVYFFPILLAFLSIQTTVAFQWSFRFKEKKKFTTTEVCFSFLTPRLLAKIYKEIHILVPLFTAFLMSYYRTWLSNLFHKLILFGFSEQNCLIRVLE